MSSTWTRECLCCKSWASILQYLVWRVSENALQYQLCRGRLGRSLQYQLASSRRRSCLEARRLRRGTL